MDETIEKANATMEAETAPFRSVAWYKASDAKKKLKATSGDLPALLLKLTGKPHGWKRNPAEAFVVNDSLVLIDYANRRRREGSSPSEAIHRAGVRRFRPILLTTMTTFGGLAPMIFETSRQARFMIPMAISLGFGIVFATTITLVIVPCLYLMAEDATRIIRWLHSGDR